MSENLFMSEGLESLLPEGFVDRIHKEESRELDSGQITSMSMYSQGGVDRFSIEFLTERENARNVLLTSLHKTVTLPQYFGPASLKIDAIEIKEPGPSLTLRGLVTYK